VGTVPVAAEVGDRAEFRASCFGFDSSASLRWRRG
jgi:hypothetical protein